MLDDHPASFEQDASGVPLWMPTSASLLKPDSPPADIKGPSALPMSIIPDPDEARSYRPSVISRWIGFGGTALIYVAIGTGALLTLETMKSPRIEPPALTVIQLNAPAPPVVQPPKPQQAPAEKRQKRPAPTPVRAIPLPPPIIPITPSVAVAAVEPISTQGEMVAPDTIATPPASQDVASPASDDWESRILGALNKHRRYPHRAMVQRQQGVPYIRFVIDREGRIVSTRLDRSSGHRDLDREALALPRRAEPLPKPPKDKMGDTIELVVPVEFFLR